MKPKNFERNNPGFLVHTVIIFIGLVFIQFTLTFIPLTVKDYEIALSIQFAGPSEEAFFRGVLGSAIILMFQNVGAKIRILGKEISVWVLFGIILISLGFAMLHVNYYSNMRYLLGTFVCGFWLGITYWYWEDLTANILAHCLLNFICLINSFWLVYF